MNPAAPNLGPLPIDDPHMRIANHEDLRPGDAAIIEGRMLDNPDDFAAWEAEIRTLDAEPAPTPEDTRSKETLSSLMDRPAFIGTAEPATDITDRERTEETRGLLHALAVLAEEKPENTDTVDKNDPNYKKIRDAMINMGMSTDAEVEKNYLDNYGASGKQMQRWNDRKQKLVDAANAMLADHPEQSTYFLTQGKALEHNVAGYHDASSGGKSRWDKASEALTDAQAINRRIRNDPTRSDSDLVPAMARIGERDNEAKYRTMHGGHAQSVKLSENYNDLLTELSLDHNDGDRLVTDFVNDFETRQGRNINEAVRELNEGKTFRNYLEASTDPIERAKAEQPLWRDIVYTGRAAQELQKQLADMRTKGVSLAHSHYREMSAKFAEVQRAHVSSWQRWQTVRQQRAAEANPLGKPDFQGRKPVFIASDQEKGVYVSTGPHTTIAIVYPDASVRSVAVGAPGAAPTIGNRLNLDGSAWKASAPVELTYEEAAPIASTSGAMGGLALHSVRLSRAAGIDKRRVDNRDLPTLAAAYSETNFQVKMRPADHEAIEQAYATARLLEQRVSESIDVLEAIDPADLTPAQRGNLDTMLRSRSVLQARAKYLEHGSKDNTSTMDYTGVISFSGTMYGQERVRDWRVAPSGDAVAGKGAAQQLYRADGTPV